ncbi:MAG: aminotransferase class V-fold PLP-dependent enzyme [Planctomycetota bacterium]
MTVPPPSLPPAPGPSRRRFLGSALGVAALGPLADVRAAFAADLQATGQDPSREDYALDPTAIYLNHASLGTVPRAVHKAHLGYLDTLERNPWLYTFGGAWDASREQTREAAAALLGCDADEVALTHNTTEAFNLLAAGLPLGTGDEVVFSALNHSGASVCWHHWAKQRGYAVRKFALPPTEAARMTTEELVAAHVEPLTERTKILVLPHVDNMVGVRHPIAEITRAAKRAGVEFVAVDGAQAVGMFDVDVTALGVDFYATSAHKWLQAPKGSGLLVVRRALRDVVHPMWVTWGQAIWSDSARRFEDYGTRDLPAVLALGDAMAALPRITPERRQRHFAALRTALRRRVESVPQLDWRSPAEWADGGSLASIEVRGHSARDVAKQLWERHRIVVRGFDGDGLNALRVSPGLATGPKDCERLLDVLTREFCG